MKYVLMNGYGLMSFCAGHRLLESVPRGSVLSLFCDTKYEDEDTYAWGRAAVDALGVLRVEIADGRNIWQLFRDRRMIGNTRIDPCSEDLKRKLARKWMEAEFPDPATAIVVVGIHAEEGHRLPAIQANWAPYAVRAPLNEGKIIGLSELERWAADAGLWKQQLYLDGFPHANCGGRCVKQGHGGFIRLLELRPAKFLEMEREEESMRRYLGKDVAILRDRRGGTTKPLTLRALRERVEQGRRDECDLFDVGGCGCFTDS